MNSGFSTLRSHIDKYSKPYIIAEIGVNHGGSYEKAINLIDLAKKGGAHAAKFQSYKAGYIDDFECWYNPESKKFDVRSASRLGVSDLGVNGKRLEYIGTRLEKEYGWSLQRRKSGKLV